MANGRFTLGKQSGGTLGLVFPDGLSDTEVVLPESGELATKEYADTKQSKSELAYDVDTSSYIPNTLASGAIIERGSNANGNYVKFADGTLMCWHQILTSTADHTLWTFPAAYIDPSMKVIATKVSGSDIVLQSPTLGIRTSTTVQLSAVNASSVRVTTNLLLMAIGRWK